MNIDSVLSKFNIFLTGGSGFIGCVILQRLLQISNTSSSSAFASTSSNLGTIFLLLRANQKYGSVEQRLRNQIFTQKIFDDMDSEQIEDLLVNQRRVIAIEGDLTSDSLGIREKHLSQMQCPTNGKPFIVIHCAADVDFKREINQALDINVNGTFQCIRVAKQIQAKAFLHISTLYVNSRLQTDSRILERMYDTGFDAVSVFDTWLNKCDKHFTAAQVHTLIKSKIPPENDNNNNVDNSSPSLMTKVWQNHYVLTKNIAEKVAVNACNTYKIPLSIARLGIISPMRHGKHRGWFLGRGGFVFIAIGQATGNIKFLHGDGEGRPDFIPVDYTVNALIAILSRMAYKYLQNSHHSHSHQYLDQYQEEERDSNDCLPLQPTESQEQESTGEQLEEEKCNNNNINMFDTAATVAASAMNPKKHSSHFDGDTNGKIYQIGVVAKDIDWNLKKLTAYLVPNWHAKKLPNSPKNAGLQFVQSAVLFFLIELVLYDIPLFFIWLIVQLLQIFSYEYWYRIWYKFFGLQFYPDMYSINAYYEKKTADGGSSMGNKHQQQTSSYVTATQIRSIEMHLLSPTFKPFLRKLQFMIKARERLIWFHQNYAFFVSQKWTFDHTNVKELFSSLDLESQKKYDFNISTFDLNSYCLDVAVVCYLTYLKYRTNHETQKKQHRIILGEKLWQLKKKSQLEFAAKFLTAEQQFLSSFRRIRYLVGIGYRWYLALGFTAVVGFLIYMS